MPSLDGKEEHKLEYIKQMIDLVNQDKRAVMLYISFIIGTFVLTISQFNTKLLEMSSGLKIICFFIAITLVTSCFFHFRYWRMLHRVSMKFIRCIPTLNTFRVRELWAGKYGVNNKNRTIYLLANYLMAIGYTGYLIMIVYIFFKTN